MSESPKTEIIDLGRRRRSSDDLTGTLSVLEGPGVGRFFAITPDEEFSIGRAEDCDASFPHPSMSRRHAVVLVSQLEDRMPARIRDLDSTNGVRVNRSVAEEHLLVSGDKIRMGRVTLRFEWMSPEEVAYQRRLADDHKVATRDHLSGLLTRDYLDDRLPELLRESDEEGSPACCLLMDLDRFKHVNDTHGHLAGDAVIRRVSQTVMETLNRSDIALRYGGEEILCVLPRTDLKAAAELGEKLRAAVEVERDTIGGDRIGVTISLGLALRRPGETALAWIGRADLALMRAKRAGRNCLIIASDVEQAVFETEPADVTDELGERDTYREVGFYTADED